jgi:hypothetical protein
MLQVSSTNIGLFPMPPACVNNKHTLILVCAEGSGQLRGLRTRGVYWTGRVKSVEFECVCCFWGGGSLW